MSRKLVYIETLDACYYNVEPETQHPKIDNAYKAVCEITSGTESGTYVVRFSEKFFDGYHLKSEGEEVLSMELVLYPAAIKSIMFDKC